MKRKCMAVSVLVLVYAVGFVGCKKAEPPSPIVKMMEDAGSGDVSKTSDEGITRWLDQHKPVLLEVKKKCIEVRASNPPANWSETTEGRVCANAYLLDTGTPLKTGDKKY
jgi:hypothetical protein